MPAAKMAKSLGLSIEAVRQAIADIDIQPDHVLDGCAYYSQATARRIREHIKK
jgi:hypothetical protein